MEQLQDVAGGVWQYLLAALVPLLVAFIAAWLQAQTALLKARQKHILAEAGLEVATAVVLAVEAEARGRWDGPSKKAAAEDTLRQMGLAFAIPYLEQAVAYCEAELKRIADKARGGG